MTTRVYSPSDPSVYTLSKGVTSKNIYKVYPTVPCASAEDCPVHLVCEPTGGRRLRFGAAKTGVCVDLRT